MFHSTDRLAIFIDGSNLYSAARALQHDLDFKRMLDWFRAKSILTRAYYYTGDVGRLGLLRRDDRDAHALGLDRLNGATEIAITREQNDMIQRRRQLHHVHRDFDVHIALDAAVALTR